MKGIYMFRNIKNNLCYIGLSTNLEERYKQHKRLSKKENPTKEFYKAIQKFGFENFEYLILEECDNKTTRQELNEKEKYYIKKYNSFKNGYNMTEGGGFDIRHNAKLSLDEVLEIVDILKNSTILEEEISEMFNVSISTISMINQGKIWSEFTSESFPIRDFNLTRAKGERVNTSKSSDQEILDIRKRYVNESLTEIYKDYKDKYSFSGFKKICYGQNRLNVPYYKKREHKWFLNGTCIDYPSEGE